MHARIPLPYTRAMDLKTLSLRLPVDVYTELQAIADREDRSLTQQIVYACRRYVEAYKEQGPTRVKPTERG